jgi:serine/threonine protein kinase
VIKSPCPDHHILIGLIIIFRKKILLTNLEDCLVLDDENNDLIKSQQGCPAYVSPEVLNSAQTHYSGKLSDTWSLGIVLYTLLFGRYPFHHHVITTMFAKIAKGKFAIPTNGISLDAKILLRSLIRLKASERLMPDEIIKTNWFKDFSFTDYKNVYEINKTFNNVKKYRSSSSLNSQQSGSSNSETVNYFTELMETANTNSLRNSSIIVNFQDDQAVPN